MIEIKQRYTNAILFTINAPSLRNADLCDANLCGANLCGADLCGANLCGANLCGADLCGANLYDEKLRSNPIFIYGLKWCIVVTNKYLTIGCQRHLITDWQAFSDMTISNMHRDALNFWKIYKPMLMQLCTIQAMKMEETT